MRDLVFTGSHLPLTDQDLTVFEKKHGIKLPPGYRSFLLCVNGGHPHKPLAPGCCYIQNFYAIVAVSKPDSLERDMALMEDDLPAGIIPIGYANGGDRVCVRLSDDAVYLWEREKQYGNKPPSVGELRLISKNIEELLDMLEGDEVSVPDEEVDKIGRWGSVRVLDDYLRAGHDINEISASGKSIVRSAAYSENLEFIMECVKRGAILKNRGLLHAAAFKMEAGSMTYFLEQGLDPNELDERGRTPLDCAPTWASGPAVQLLKQAGGINSVELGKRI